MLKNILKIILVISIIYCGYVTYFEHNPMYLLGFIVLLYLYLFININYK